MGVGCISIWRYHLFSKGVSIIKIRWSHVHLIFKMGIPIPGKDCFYNESGPRTQATPSPVSHSPCRVSDQTHHCPPPPPSRRTSWRNPRRQRQSLPEWTGKQLSHWWHSCVERKGWSNMDEDIGIWFKFWQTMDNQICSDASGQITGI